MVNETGFLQLDENHQIYYQRIGNTVGPTILFLHGGPGLGFSEKDHQFFDFEKCNVIFFDQRGAGKSKCSDPLINNTTQDLINDINEIYDCFDLKQCIIFGGSWGSTLALFYAIVHPKRVKSLIMRGLFTGTRADRFAYEQGGLKELFPKEWERLKLVSEEEEDSKVMDSLYRDIVGLEKGIELSLKAFELMLFGASINNQGHTKELEESMKEIDYSKRAKILSYYALNDFFVENMFIEKNKKSLHNIPISIVHGEADYVCPVNIALGFSKDMPNVSLEITNEGHSPYSKENKRLLVEALTKHMSIKN